MVSKRRAEGTGIDQGCVIGLVNQDHFAAALVNGCQEDQEPKKIEAFAYHLFRIF